MYTSLSSKDLKTPTERTRLGHNAWIRELLEVGIVQSVQWCDTRGMTADGHAKDSIDRELLILLKAGHRTYAHEVKTYVPFRASSGSQPATGAGSGKISSERRNAPTTYFVAPNTLMCA